MRLLVAYDGSAGGRDALELGRVLCTATGAGALVVDVVYSGPLPMEFALLPEEEVAAAGPAFAVARDVLAGIEVETRAYGGGSPAAIIDAGLATVAVGYLGTAESKVALRRAVQLVDPAGRIEILTVVEPPLPLSPAGENLTKPLDPEQVAAEGVGMVPAGLAVEARKLSGAAAPELERTCAQGVDLLVVGSRGYGPVRSVLFGSVSGHALRHVRCPLLVTRRP